MRILHADAPQHARARIHRRVRELVGVHLTQTLVALDVGIVRDVSPFEVRQTAGELVIGVRVDELALVRAASAMRCSGGTAA